MRFASIVSLGLKALLLGVLSFTFQLQAQSNVSVRVMAANLNGNTQSYQPFALRIFQGTRPDVVCIQEFNYTSTNGLGTNTPAAMREMIDAGFGTNFVYFREPLNGGGDIPNGIISRYPFVASGSWTDTLVANRGFAWAQIDLPGTNDLYVVSVHLLTSSSANRAAESGNLKALMQSNFPANAWIAVAGDFNAGSRTESCITTFNSYLTDFPVPVDNSGNSDTSANRNSPHDFVLPSITLTNFETATIFGSLSYSNGLVFDSRVYSANGLTNFPPVQSADSGLAQHMAVMKDFFIPGTTNSTTATTNAPNIAAQPQSLTVSPGSNVTFTVTASGTAPLAYQWFFNGTNISGATTNPFALNNAQFTNAGNYFVWITNLYGSVTSSAALLTVTNLPPTITTNPVSRSVFVGGNVTFNVTVSGTAPLYYQWLFNGTNITAATTNFYSITNVQLTNAGNYSVLITNFAGSATSSPALLTVNTNITGTTVLLAGWDTSTQSSFGSSPLSPTTNAPNLTITGLTRGGGVTISGSASAGGWGGNGFDAANAAAAITAGDYATFSIAVNPGYAVSFGSINRFDYRRSSTGPAAGVLQYQVGTGGFNDITNLAYPTASAGASIGAIDLSSIASLQNVGSNIVVTFRIVNYGGATAGTWYIYNTISGTAPDLSVQGIINSTSTPTGPPAAAAVLGTPNFTAGQFQMSVTGSLGSNYVVQVTTNLATATNWVSLFTNTSPYTFTETNLSAAQKFYRAVSSP